MAGSRRALMELDGFDERIRPVSEDDDLAFRWLRAGRKLRYDPELKVWHTAWRTESELRQVYRGYAQGDGMLYAKHLLDGDLLMVWYIITDLLRAVVAELQAAILRKRRPWDHRLEIVPHLFIGLLRGFRTYRRG
jgi:GT2 family glycosyltransferase